MRPTTKQPAQAQDYWLKRRQCQDRLTDLLAQFGYQLLDTPILEPTELFLRQSGGALASQMYSFTDPGGQKVSLRPEFTAPIMRHYLEHSSALGDTARFQYAGPVFRFEEGGRGSGQFTQVGAELIGAAGVDADAELLALAARVPAHLGIGGVVLELADVSVPHRLMDALGLSSRARSFIMGQVPELRRGPAAVHDVLARAMELGLAGAAPDDDGLATAIAGLDDTQARRVLRGLFNWQGTSTDAPQIRGANSGLGQRQPDEVVDRLLRKLRGGDTPEQMAQGLELMAALAALRGAPPAVVDQARKLMAKAGASTEGLERLAELTALLQKEPELRGRLVVDFGLVRELAYYNGIVFQATRPGSAHALGGGGRYDGLARALGGSHDSGVPALGFAYNLESLVELAE
ncbi:MAG: hypothetical protein EXR46_10125 [Dehalococcoidia bacterium]|nr:hypothetical protein [Dehalococcoidia bacterium]